MVNVKKFEMVGYHLLSALIMLFERAESFQWKTINHINVRNRTMQENLSNLSDWTELGCKWMKTSFRNPIMGPLTSVTTTTKQYRLFWLSKEDNCYDAFKRVCCREQQTFCSGWCNRAEFRYSMRIISKYEFSSWILCKATFLFVWSAMHCLSTIWILVISWLCALHGT